MRSLSLLQDFRFRQAQGDGIPQTFAVDPFEKQIYALGSSDYLFSIDYETGKAVDEKILISDELSCAEREWRSINYLADLELLCCVANTGEVVTTTIEDERMDVVGAFDDGIAACMFNPEQDVLAVVSLTGQLILMTTEWEVTSEESLGAINCEEGIEISWRGDGEYFAVLYSDETGRRVTVFERSGAKHSEGRNINNSAVKGMMSPISWAPDGSLIASCAVIRKKTQVIFFERNGLRHGEFILPNIDPKKETVTQIEWNSTSSLLGVVITSLETGSSVLQLWSRRNYHWYRVQTLPFNGSAKLCFDPSEENSAHIMSLSGIGNEIAGEFAKLSFAWDMHTCGDDSVAMVVDGCDLKVTPFKKAIVPPPMSMGNVKLPDNINCVAPCPTAILNYILKTCPKACQYIRSACAVITTDAVLHVIAGTTIIGSIDLKEDILEDASRIRHLCWSGLDTTHGSFRLVAVLGSSSSISDPQPYSDMFVCLDVDMDVDGDEIDVSLVTCDVFADVCEFLQHLAFDHGACALGYNGSRDVARMCSDGCDLFIEMQDGNVMSRSGMKKLRSAAHQLVPVVLPLEDETTAATTGVSTTKKVATAQDITAATAAMSIASVEDNFSDSEDDMEVPTSQPATSNVPKHKYVLVSLDSKGHLCADGTLLATNVNSFAIHEAFKLVVYAQHRGGTTLHVIPFSMLHNPLPYALDLPQKERTPEAQTLLEECAKLARPLEMGASIVSLIPGGIQVVLQMPRGNLECISPRALVLDECRFLLDRLEFGKALELLRTHRVDFNLLFDHNPSLFISNLTKFCEQVASSDRFSLFIAALNNGDITKTKCTCPPWFKHSHEYARGGFDEDKVTFVCGAMRLAILRPEALPVSGSITEMVSTIRSAYIQLDEEVMSEQVPTSFLKCKFLPSVLCSYSYTLPHRLSHALALIRAIDSSKETDLAMTTDRAVKHIVLIAKSDAVYNAALASYDLTLCGLIASRMQKDPREYMPFFEELQKLSEPRRRYRIDISLKNYTAALRNLSQEEGAFEECLTLTKEHKLFELGCEVFPLKSYPKEHREMLIAYGFSLKSLHKEGNNYGAQAAQLFLSAQPPALQEALDAQEMSLDWRGALISASRLGQSDEEVADMVFGMAERLSQSHYRRHEAATLMLDYHKDVDEAVQLLVRGGCWSESLRVSAAHKRRDLWTTTILPAALAAYEYNIEDSEKRLKKWDYVAKRLEIVRAQQIEAQEFVSEEVAVEADVASVWTDATGATGFTQMTSSGFSLAPSFFEGGQGGGHATGKNKKKKKRTDRRKGRGRIKEGSPYEEWSLLKEVDKIKPSSQVAEEVKELIDALLVLERVSQAKKLQECFEKWVLFYKNNQPREPVRELLIPPYIVEEENQRANNAAKEPVDPATELKVEDVKWYSTALKL
eukprot:TRINITY_DN8684_c0_g1_i1.p1 TRINITY_DN8684_c0_g1~~TRINITY_DN8684_c0_g1_i1.p1  ORF type:complete len:1410 (-),score=532.69 TRINITY_DN8684_c0_g1_i1:105-4334(-)